MQTNSIRVIVVDDHLIVRKGTRAFLAEFNGIEIIGDAGNGQEAIQLVENLHPDVVLIDLMMPGMDGIQTIQHMRALNHDARIVIMTSFIAQEKVVLALKAGAHSYLLKDSPPEDLIQTIMYTYRGEAILHHGTASKIFELFKTGNPNGLLTPVESEILMLLTNGYDENENARKVGISEAEFRGHIFQIIQKLHQLFAN